MFIHCAARHFLISEHVATQPFLKQELDRKFELIYDSDLFELTTEGSDTIKTMCSY